jgi:hypothetical protein
MFHSPHYTFNKHYSIADCFSGKTEDVRLHEKNKKKKKEKKEFQF